MVFSSSTFLFLFLPFFLAVYFVIPTRYLKNSWLLLASLLFYAWGEPVYVLLMILSIITNWALAICLDRANRLKWRTILLILAATFNILIIGFFKYESFIANNINGLLGVSIVPNLELPLPIGISFYTLQALSYVIDVYRKEVPAQKNILYLGMYISCFPQLIAGPIVRYKTIQEQIIGRRENLNDFTSGLRLFIVGLSKKVLLANTCAILATKMLSEGGPAIGMVGAWAGLTAYTFQIYFDFGGYSDMAIGLGRMMGFKYLRNFNYPYISRSITEFWRRWHISLSTFFRDYVYIPLGGSRVSTLRWVLNIAIVWAITGLWHGAAWNYIGWGVYYGLLLIGEKLVWGKVLSRIPEFFQHVYTIFIFMFGWSFFWITDFSQLVSYWQAMFGSFGVTGTSTFWELTAWEYWPVLLVCCFASVPFAPMLKERFLKWVSGGSVITEQDEECTYNVKHTNARNLCCFDASPISRSHEIIYHAAEIMWDIVLIILLCFSIFSVVSGSFNPFIYFQF